MQLWLIFSLATLVSWGIWRFLSKLAVKRIEPKSAILYEILGGLVVGIVVFFFISSSVSLRLFPITTGIFAGITLLYGVLMFFTALRKGEKSVVVPLNALYPVLTILLGYFIIAEGLSVVQGIGVLLAMVASYLVQS